MSGPFTGVRISPPGSDGAGRAEAGGPYPPDGRHLGC